MDPFDDTPTPEERTAAMLAILRQRGLGNTALAVGGRHQQAFGQSQIQQADNAQTGLLQALKARRAQSEHYQKTPEELAALEALAAERNARASHMGEPVDAGRLELARLKADGVRLRNEAQRRKLEHSEANEGKQLPPTVVAELADYETAIDQVNKLSGEFDDSEGAGMAAKIGRMATEKLGLQDTESAKYEAAKSPVRQGVGTILENGKMAAGDEVKYNRMLPERGDARDVKNKKASSIIDYLKARKEARLGALKSAGYRVPGGGTPTGPTGSVVRRLYSAKSNKTKLIYSDGREEIVDGKQ